MGEVMEVSAGPNKLRIVSFNVNGLRACLKRKFGTVKRLLEEVNADILCVQETKLRRSELERDLAMVDGWDAFFACAQSPKGYSGVATYVRSALALPCAAEEGFSGLCAAGAPAPAGGGAGACIHPALAQRFAVEELQELDSEGRVVITDHGSFVLFNVYGPALSSEDPDTWEQRLNFKLHFYQEAPETLLAVGLSSGQGTGKALQCRWDDYLLRGRALVVVGDLNICPATLDTVDPEPNFYRETRPDRLWLRGLLHLAAGSGAELVQPALAGACQWNGQAAGPVEATVAAAAAAAGGGGGGASEAGAAAGRGGGSEAAAWGQGGAAEGRFTDVFRAFHSRRQQAFTCWRTATSARVNNYGSRIDLVLAAGLHVCREAPTPGPAPALVPGLTPAGVAPGEACSGGLAPSAAGCGEGLEGGASGALAASALPSAPSLLRGLFMGRAPAGGGGAQRPELVPSAGPSVAETQQEQQQQQQDQGQQWSMYPHSTHHHRLHHHEQQGPHLAHLQQAPSHQPQHSSNAHHHHSGPPHHPAEPGQREQQQPHHRQQHQQQQQPHHHHRQQQEREQQHQQGQQVQEAHAAIPSAAPSIPAAAPAGPVAPSAVWLSACDILADMEGSDHAPVWVDVSYWGRFPCAEVAPSCGARHQFTGKQLKLHGWLARGPGAAAQQAQQAQPQGAAPSQDAASWQQEQQQQQPAQDPEQGGEWSEGCSLATLNREAAAAGSQASDAAAAGVQQQPGYANGGGVDRRGDAAAAGGRRSVASVPGPGKRQTSLRGFFAQPPGASAQPSQAPRRPAVLGAAPAWAGGWQGDVAAPATAQVPCCSGSSSTWGLLASAQQQGAAAGAEAGGAAAGGTAAGSQGAGRLGSGAGREPGGSQAVGAASGGGRASTTEAADAWRRIQQQMAVPRCLHGEPAVLKRVNKSGPNHGRFFYVCKRPDGPKPEGQCSFFQW